ncbi:hypothetical protein GCM10012275_02120 [Longimycelium tulufanense]|uniref:Transposase IS110-like N-terminal domain-containing protein n=1 Tax=Longimycelium tulufanense TaxID=907463 RepID=A0A8J3C5T3_9PSEU|nr:hypothetical protein GCM10012275_02120 [Longimycelium tulufanense]
MAACKEWAGIDVGKGFHHAYAVDETGTVVFPRKVVNGQAAIEQLIARTIAETARMRGDLTPITSPD